jgi:hypothetical protein
LFNNLPRRCFLLLKDIDVVGIRRASPIVITEDTTTAPEAPKIKTQDKPDSILSRLSVFLRGFSRWSGYPLAFPQIYEAEGTNEDIPLSRAFEEIYA